MREPVLTRARLAWRPLGRRWPGWGHISSQKWITPQQATGYWLCFVMPDLRSLSRTLMREHPVFFFLDSGVRRNDGTAASRGEW